MAYVAQGSEFLVNTVTAGRQFLPTITGLADGGFVVSWVDSSNISGYVSNWDIKAQIFGASGAAVGGEFLVNTVTAGSQWFAKITGLADGGFVVGWHDDSQIGGDASNSGVKAQIYGASGAAVGREFLVNTLTAGNQNNLSIVGLTDGGFVVSWVDDTQSFGGSTRWNIKAQIYGESGARVGNEFVVNTVTTGVQSYPTITGLANGGFLVGWTDDSRIGGDPSQSGVKAQVYGASGARVGGEFLVNTITEGSQNNPTITGLANGGFVVSWMDGSQTGRASGYDVKAQIYAESGARVGGEFLVNSVTLRDQGWSTITGLADGGFVVSWVDDSRIGGDSSRSGIKAQIYGASGTAVGGEFLVNTVTTDFQDSPTITGLTDGGFVISWADSSQIGGDGVYLGIKAQIYASTGQISTNGDDTLFGTASADTLIGLAGNDNLEAGGGDDLLNGGVGNDVLNGGGGTDAATFVDAAKGVQVNLALSGAQFTGSGNDTLVSIENLIGSAFNDRLSGDGNANVLDGGSGRDTLTGGAGADTFVLGLFVGAPKPDTIRDFAPGEDVIELSALDFTAFASDPLGALSASAFHVGTRAINADQHIIYDAATGALFYDADGNGGIAQVAIATLTTRPAIDAGDFILI